MIGQDTCNYMASQDFNLTGKGSKIVLFGAVNDPYLKDEHQWLHESIAIEELIYSAIKGNKSLYKGIAPQAKISTELVDKFKLNSQTKSFSESLRCIFKNNPQIICTNFLFNSIETDSIENIEKEFIRQLNLYKITNVHDILLFLPFNPVQIKKLTEEFLHSSNSIIVSCSDQFIQKEKLESEFIENFSSIPKVTVPSSFCTAIGMNFFNDFENLEYEQRIILENWIACGIVAGSAALVLEYLTSVYPTIKNCEKIAITNKSLTGLKQLGYRNLPEALDVLIALNRSTQLAQAKIKPLINSADSIKLINQAEKAMEKQKNQIVISSSEIIESASRYVSAPDTWVVTSFFNPIGYKTRLTNFDFFASKLYQSNINLLVIECAFGDSPFSLDPSPNILQVRAKDIMWQKERLLNIAISRLPKSCTKVVWLDCDILFENPEWLVETSRMLEDYSVVQPFEEAIRLPRGSHSFIGKGERMQSFASIYAKKPQALLLGDFGFHGHTGFAWAARREILSKHGLYDECIIGGADHLMAHAFCGDWDSPCFSRVTGQNQIHHQFAVNWSQNVYKDVRANVGYIPGRILHLWHGNIADRRYVSRSNRLANFKFNPHHDICIGENGCWEWKNKNSDMCDWVNNYFMLRQEDGSIFHKH